MHIKDILSSPFAKPKEEVAVKNFGQLMNEPELPKPVSIKIERTLESENGSKTKYDLTIDHSIRSPKELRELLDAVDYFGTHSILHRIKLAIQQFLLGIIRLFRREP